MEQSNNKKEIEFGNLYDINKNLVKQAEVKLSEGLLNSKKEIIKNFIMSKSDDFYFMLLCNEKKDYTIFDFKDYKTPERSLNCAKCLVDECLINRGEIRGIDLTKDRNAIEI
jgi:hypothetical protein